MTFTATAGRYDVTYYMEIFCITTLCTARTNALPFSVVLHIRTFYLSQDPSLLKLYYARNVALFMHSPGKIDCVFLGDNPPKHRQSISPGGVLPTATLGMLPPAARYP